MRPLIVLGLVLLVAACGPDAGPESDDVVLRVMMAEDWATTAAVVDVVRRFEREHPGVQVSIIPRPFSQILEEARSEAAKGTPLDVVHHHAFAAGAVGIAEPLDAWWQDGTFSEADYFDAAVADISWGSQPYGVPLDINTLFLLHDEDLDAPATFADVEAVAAVARAEGRRGLTVSSNAWEAYGWIRANGGEVVDVDAQGVPRFTLDSPAVVEALEFLAGMVARDEAYGPRTRNVSIDAFELWTAGDTALLATGTWNVARVDRFQPQRSYRTSPMPRGVDGDTQGSALGGSSLFIGRGSSHVDTAVAFIRALTDSEVALRLAEEEGRMPPRPTLYARLPNTAALRTLREQLRTAHPMLLIAFPEASSAFAAAVEDVVTGRVSAAEALGEAQRIADGVADPS